MLGTLFASEAGHGAPSFDILTTLVVLPAVGALLVALVPRSRSELLRLVALLFTGATGALTI
jgi:NADH:ubiquinone oxidoreductase subunit 4 (subunit M)